jgi:HKD family nuclease
MSRIIDNEELRLLDVLKEHLPNSRQLDACVGYFNLRGWSSLREELLAMQKHENLGSSNERVRLLVGMAISGSDAARKSVSLLNNDGDDAVLTRAVELAKAAVREFAQQLTWGTPNEKDRVALNLLLADLKNGYLRVKFAAKTPLHAKLYVCHLAGPVQNFRAVVGSSNFTGAGLDHQGELNLEESDVQQGRKLFNWFVNKWDDNFTIDITTELINVLENCWATIEQPSPRIVHLKMAYELSRDARAGKNLEIPEKIAAELTPWQESAVRVATRMLKQRGLAVIGDVVGLGKTLTGTAIAAAFGERVLVICPKNLVKMWENHLEAYDILGTVMSLSMVTRELKDMKPYRLVLVDESHNLRHTSHSAWIEIHDYVQTWNSNVVLLTATMFNADHFDISGQLKLKLPEDMDLGIRPEEHIAHLGENGEWQLAQKTNGRLSTLTAFEQSSFAKDWQRLLGQYLIRRTRKYLEETYGKRDVETGKIYFTFNDGTRFSFPKRIAEPLKYQGGPNDPGDKLASMENFDALDGMKFARYQPGRYLKDGVKPLDASEKLLLDDMMRANSTNGFIKTTVLKRLASSPMAFFITVEKMLLRANILKYALENGLDLPIGTLDDRAYFPADTDSDIEEESDLPELPNQKGLASSWVKGFTDSQWESLASKNYESLKNSNPRGLRWARHELFDASKFALDVASDNAVLQRIVDEFGDWDPSHDSKLIALAERVNSLPKGEKLLVFSEYKDTIDYVFKYLVPLCPGVEIGSVSGKSDNPSVLARRFSPKSNLNLGGLPKDTTELQVLLATDVLSEGQNLQDSALVLNWDLPWTIIKIIQRAGRVDRIGQTSDVIHALSFMPHEGVDDRIALIRRLSNRLRTNQEIFGGSEDILRLDFADDEFDLLGLFDGKKEIEAYEGEVDYGSYALGIWDGATQAERDLAVGLPAGAATTKYSLDETLVSLAHAKVIQSEQAPVDLIAAMDSDGKIRTLTQLEALKMTSATAEAVAAEPIQGHFDHVHEILKLGIAPQAKLTKILLNHGLRKNLYTL